MIDTFALALGHGLLALALLRLALRGDVDADPLIGRLAEDAAAARRKRPAKGARSDGSVAAAPGESGKD
jgi:hypothetical protein